MPPDRDRAGVVHQRRTPDGVRRGARQVSRAVGRRRASPTRDVTIPTSRPRHRQHTSTITTPINSPDVIVTKSHNGNFTFGSTGVYTLTAHNIGALATSGTITIIDTLPAGLTFQSAAGTGLDLHRQHARGRRQRGRRQPHGLHQRRVIAANSSSAKPDHAHRERDRRRYAL